MMEKKKLQPVSDKELKATTGGDWQSPSRGCGTAMYQKSCERYSDCCWDESKQKCRFK